MSEPTMNTMEHNSNDPNTSNKRKREAMDTGDVQRLRSAHGGPNNFDVNIQATENYGYDAHGMPNNTTDLSHIDQQLLQAVGNQNGVSDENAMTAKAALAAHQPESKYPPPEPSFDSNGLGNNLAFGQDVGQVSMGGVQGHTSTAAAVYAAREAQAQAAQQISPKPTVGSVEWHQVRKNNHKEVERRRRETINEGINEIAKMVPGCEKAKGSILQRAIQYIAKLQEDSKEMAARFDTTNMTTNQAITEISTQNAKLKNEVNLRSDIAAKWIQRCRDAGLNFDDYDDEKSLGKLPVDESHNI
ncbi:basic helix-loop-helix protein [Microsporum canis]|uniref:PENR2 protein n=1 Tax=Arthroderma otae (strain ATCC MYA-4605 / CBS 113480) TaxID=554155 RepID=C5FWB7_ARTOC|nr:PENR2 protein [Microsporum canis CBS 113480]EEQ34201.1 PENR2 protein [Microsporum canis CBS 113480]